MTRGHRATTLSVLEFARPALGPRFAPTRGFDLPLSADPGWRSNGGPSRGHPARSFPYTLEAGLPTKSGLVRVHLVGVFAQYAGSDHEVAGTLGAAVQLMKGGEIVYRLELVNGRHYSDAAVGEPIQRVLGDGSSIQTLGSVRLEEADWRVDVLTIDLPPELEADSFRFKTLSSPAGFTLFDVILEAEEPHGCPFHSSGGGVPLARMGAIVRLGDRVEFAKAMGQLELGILSTPDLDEARGQVLTFQAVVTAAMLEMGGGRELVREQLALARELDQVQTTEEIAAIARRRVGAIAEPLFHEASSHSEQLIDRALAWVERNYAKSISDATVARYLGLSTSHFRFLFKQATGQPFHKYLIAVRLEKARHMLLDPGASVSAVAKAVGFSALSHFSRAFTNRFSVSPTQIRRGVS